MPLNKTQQRVVTESIADNNNCYPKNASTTDEKYQDLSLTCVDLLT